MARFHPIVGRVLVAVSLACLAVACGGNEETVQETRPEAQGERGESCRARNDCVEGLACINNTCVQNEYPIEPTAGACELIECDVNRDCCDSVDTERCAELEVACPRTTAYSANCRDLRTACEEGDDFEACNEFATNCNCFVTRESCSEGDEFACEQVDAVCTTTFDCGQYLTECVCADSCVDSVCLGGAACFVDDDCFGGTCVAGVCDFRCTTDEDCGDGEQCIAGACTIGCTDRNECGFFEDCVNGTCTDVGCTTDRECAAFADNGLATCIEGECVVPCLNDAECNNGGWDFQSCIEGICRYVGCQTDEECYLSFARDLGGLPPGVSAVCTAGQ